MAGFGDCIADMDAMIMASLGDGAGDYQHQDGQVIRNVELIIDHNLQINGPEGLYRSDVVGITWQQQAIPCSVGRGGIFVYRKRRYLVEDILVDDGHMATAACMEQR